MPSITQAQLQELRTSFTNASLLESSAHSGGFYHTVDFKRDAKTGTPTISADKRVEVVVKSAELSTCIEMQYGGRPVTRTAVQEGTAKINQVPSRRLFTINTILTLVDGQGERMVPMHVRSEGTPLAGSLTTQSGLVSEQPHSAVYRRMNEELGLVRLNHDKQTVEILVIQPDPETAKLDDKLKGTIVNDKMKLQRPIRAAVAQATGIPAIETANVDSAEFWGIDIVLADAKLNFTNGQEKSGMVEHVEFGGLFNANFQQPAVVHDDEARQTVTLTIPYTVQLPEGWSSDNMAMIDPEGFKREMHLFSEDEFEALRNGLTPSLADYLRQLRGEPAPQAAAPVAAPDALAPAAR